MTHFFSFTKFFIPGLLLLILAACSAEEPSAPYSGPYAVPVPVAESSAQPAPGDVPVYAPAPPSVEPAPGPLVMPVHRGRYGGSLTLAGMADIPHRDVHQESQETLAVMGPGLAYSRLLRIGTGLEHFQPNLSLECDLCESWKLTQDLAYEFRLRSDVRWHNVAPVNGRKLVADDLAYSYLRMRTPGWPGAVRFADRGIGEIEAVDDHTLRVNLNFLDSDALLVLADGRSKIVAPEVVEQYGDLRQSPVVGTGPWIWEGAETGVGGDVRFSRNPGYFDAKLPYLDELTIKAIKSPGVDASQNQERIAVFRAGLVDVIVAPPTDWAQLEGSSEEFNSRVSHQPEIGVVMSLNVQAAPLDNLLLRRAIFKAVDPWEYVDVNWAGQGNVGMGMPLSGPDWRLTHDEMRADYLASPSEARDILVNDSMHYPPLQIELAVANLGPDYLALGHQIADDLAAVGLAPTVRPVPPTQINELMFGSNRQYQIVLGPVPPHSTTNGYLFALLHSDGPGNIIGHQDAVLDRMIERQAAELNPARRQAQLKELQRHLLDQAYVFSPITGSYRWVFDWNLKDFYPNTALSEYYYWAEVWLE